MGMSTYVVGIRPADEKFKKMKAIYDQCIEMEIATPEEVDAFFEGECPDEKGVHVEIMSTDWAEDCACGIEVCVDELPKDVKIIRFVNSY